MSIIVPNLRVKMAERGWNIKEVKERTSLSRTTISNMYNFYSDGIKFDTLAELCDLFNCTPNDLLLIIPVEVFSVDVKDYELAYEDKSGGFIRRTYDLSVKTDYKIGLQDMKDVFNFKIEASAVLEDGKDTLGDYEARLNFHQTNDDISTYLTYSDTIMEKIYVDLESKINQAIITLLSSTDTPLEDLGPINDWLEFLPSTRSVDNL